MNILLLNDTGNIWHIGCQGVSDAHARMLGRRGHQITRRFFNGELAHLADRDAERGVSRALSDPRLQEAIQATDAVVVNGEGTIHHGAGTELLNVLGAARECGKLTLLVNCVLEEVDGFDHVLSGLNDIVVRDARTSRYLNEKGISARTIHDSFVEAGFDQRPIADWRDRVVVTDWHHQRDHDVGRKTIEFLRSKEPGRHCFLPFLCRDAADAWARIPATIGTARVVVTGRHHGIYAAALAGVPFVALSSNTHKIEGFIEAFPELAFCLNPKSIEDAVAEALDRSELFRVVQHSMFSSRPLSTFEALGGVDDPQGEARELARLARDCVSRQAVFGHELAYRLERRSFETCVR